MNQNEWLASDDPRAMLDHLEEHATDRKLRLFAVACCRRFWSHLARDEVSRQAVEVAEQFAEGATTKECLRQASYAIPWRTETDPVLRAVRDTAKAAVNWLAGDAATDTCHEAILLAGRAAEAAAL